MKNQKYKFKLHRLLAITLAIVTVLSTIPPTKTHAGDVTDTGGNAGAGKVNVSAGSDYTGWYSQTQGYRFQVVNSSFERISAIHDFSLGLGRLDDYGKSTNWKNPKKWYKGLGIEDADVDYHWETRFDTSKSPDSKYNKMYSLYKLQDLNEEERCSM